MIKLSEEQLKKIKEDFPPEAMSKDTSRGFELTSIKAMFVIERLNDTFGIFGWKYTFDEPKEKDGEYYCKVTLSITGENEAVHSISQYGGKRVVRNNITDAYKSAITDGLTKCASILGIGHKVFKGEVKIGHNATEQHSGASKTSQAAPNPDEANMRVDISEMLKEMCNGDIEAVKDSLEKISGFEGSKGYVKGKRSTLDLKGKWLANVQKKVTEEWEKWRKKTVDFNKDTVADLGMSPDNESI